MVNGKAQVVTGQAYNIVAATRENAMALANEGREITILDNYGHGGHVIYYISY